MIVNKPEFTFNFSSNGLKVKIETERLIMNSYEEQEFEDCIALYGDAKLTRYFDHGLPRTRDEIKELVNEKGLKHFCNREPFGLFSIFRKSDQVFLGQVDILPFDEVGSLEVGGILLREYHTQGYFLECLRVLVIDYIRELNLREFKCNGNTITKVIATVHPKNIPSKKVIEKLDMTFYKQEERFGNPRLWYFYKHPS